MRVGKLSVAVDGPAGSGKSTIAKILAKKYHLTYVDTGAMYRAVALKMLRNDISADDTERIQQMLDKTKVKVLFDQIYLDDEEVSALIRTPQVTNFVSIISQNPEIRKYMTNTQKEIGKTENVIMDGRDIGSVILPHADLKVYLTASPEVRAKRRFEEMQEKEGENLSLTLEDILETIQKRDFQDKTRKEAPLTVADEAVIIDSSGLTIQEVVENISVLLDKILDAKG